LKPNTKKMTAVQLNAMNTELWQSIGSIADSEVLMRRLTQYAKRLAKEKRDAALMSEQEFFARVEEARKQSGKCFNNVSELDQYLQSL